MRSRFHRIKVTAISVAAVGGSMTPFSAAAGTPESTATFAGPDESSLRIGVGYLSEDNYHFRRYTGPVDEGFYPHLDLDLRYRGTGDQDARFGRIEGRDLGTESRRLRGRYGVQGEYAVYGAYDQRPRFYDRDLQAPLWGTSRDELTLPPSGDRDNIGEWTRDWDVDTHRRQVEVGGQRVVGEDWKVNASFSREEKQGRRVQGWGDWTVPEGFHFPARIDHRTDQFDVSAEYSGDEFQTRLGYHASLFSQLEGDVMRIEDPVASDDWTDPEVRERSRSPDNSYHQIHGSLAYTVQPGTRVSGDLLFGRALQDEDFVEPDDDLPTSLDGQIDTTRLGLRGTHRLTDRVNFRAGYRYEDRDNQTEAFEDVRGFDTRPHGWTRQTVDLATDLRLPARTNAVLGYGYEETERSFGERAETEEYTVHGRLRSRLHADFSGGVRGEFSQREGAVYRFEDTAGRTPELYQYHLADLERSDLGVFGTYSVLPELAVGVEATAIRTDYTESEKGLLEDNRYAYTLSADFFPDEQLSAHAFVTYEEGDRAQADQQARLEQDTETWTSGLGVDATLTEEERLTVGADLLLVSTQTDIDVSEGSSQSYPTLSTRLRELRLHGEYEVTDTISFGAMYAVQRFRDRDWALGYGPDRDEDPDGFSFMGQEPYDYTAHLVVGYAGVRF